MDDAAGEVAGEVADDGHDLAIAFGDPSGGWVAEGVLHVDRDQPGEAVGHPAFTASEVAAGVASEVAGRLRCHSGLSLYVAMKTAQVIAKPTYMLTSPPPTLSDRGPVQTVDCQNGAEPTTPASQATKPHSSTRLLS